MQDREFRLMPSKMYISLMGATFLLSLLVFFSLPITLLYKCTGVVLVSIYGGYILWHYGLLRSRHSIIGLKYCSDGQWWLTTNSQEIPAQLLGDSTVTGWVSVLRFKTAKRIPLSCIVFRDSLGIQLYRQFISMLKLT